MHTPKISLRYNEEMDRIAEQLTSVLDEDAAAAAKDQELGKMETALGSLLVHAAEDDTKNQQ